MLKWAAVFFVIAIAAGKFGYTATAAGAATIVTTLVYIFIIIRVHDHVWPDRDDQFELNKAFFPAGMEEVM